MMQSLALTICVCLALFFSFTACSRDEEALPPLKGTKVVKPIKRPLPPPPKKAEKPPSMREGSKQAEIEKRETEAIKRAAVPAKALARPDLGGTKKETTPEQEPGHYVVKAGDSLASIAGRADVYGDPLKWPIICRFNMDKLGKMKTGGGFADRTLPEGMRLKIITPDEKEENLRKRANRLWVLNVLSSPNKREINPATIKLVEGGYSAYITRTKVKGKDYMRLRVGFFGKKVEADAAGEKIKALLDLGEPWKTKVGKEEFKEFAGY